ncbi:MAG: dacC [Planctomycetaceae bacterium]|nr:dacC [Planctomycetaceae bacterium]
MNLPLSRRSLLALIGAGMIFIAASASARGETLDEKLLPLIRAHQGQVAVAVKHLKTGVTFEYRATEPMPTASLIKFPVMIEAYRQVAAKKLKLEQMLTLKAEDQVPGSGILTTHFTPGMTLSLRDAIQLMIAFSDNTATNLVVDQIGLPSTTATMQRMNCPNTRLNAKVFKPDSSINPEQSKLFGLGSTTAAEMVLLLEKLQRGELIDPDASDAMRRHLYACEDKEKFPADLPAGTRIAHKTGSVASVRTDAGLLETPSGTIALCVLTSQNKDQRWVADNAGNILCANVARAVFEFFNDAEAPDQTDPKVLQLGASGELVEALQRTLNVRLNPSPKLTIDGDFGGTTQAVVIRFQKEKRLAATGIVGPETWTALAPVRLEEPSVPAPEVVNAEKLPKLPSDPLKGPPIVTAKAWSVGDMKTGRVIVHHNGDQRLPIASTTKVMTAHVVLSLVDANPKQLDELVEFSRRADGTGGTSSGIRAGEQLAVRELLYGLMLPSGNDAAVALAEHFGKRCQPPKDVPKTQDPLIKFVAEMNRMAVKLGMSNSNFTNPHGLPDRQHYSSANDMLALTYAACRHKLLQDCANCRQHGCRLSGPGGYHRNVIWKNTNKLLEIEGYQGLKTGTTNAAGSCLISLGDHSGRQLGAVVLGASSDENRYLDTRNLMKWVWEQK